MPIKLSRNKSLGFIILILVVGALVGSALGEVIGLVLPDGVVKQAFIRSVQGTAGPATIDLLFFSITFGCAIKLNVIGVVGIIIAAYLVRWY